MACALSTPRRAAQEAQVAVPDWSSLPGDLVRLVGGYVLGAQDLDHYVSFRGVCSKWRSATDDSKEKGLTDQRFVPSKWVLMPIKHFTENDSITLVNVDTGRFLIRSMPRLRNRYSLVGVTNGVLFLLGKTTGPHQACVLNPFTGSIAHFKASIPTGGEILEVVVTTSPIRVLMISTEVENIKILWADQDSECFREIRGVDHLNSPMCIAHVANNVYFTNVYGSIQSPDFSVSFPTMNTTIAGPEKLQLESLESGRYYLIKSGEDLFLATRPWRGLPTELVVRRVDIKRKMLEPVRNIGNNALFVSYMRCLAVDASKFHTIEGGCIYFVDPITDYGQGTYKNSVITMFHVADGVQKRMFHRLSAIGGCSLPSTLPLLFVEYCNSIPYYELFQEYLEEGGSWDDLEFDAGSSESDEGSSESDDELWIVNGCYERCIYIVSI